MAAHADNYDETVAMFKHAGDSADYFSKSYAYAVFPTIGEAGFIIGGAHGKGRVYAHDKYVGDTSMTQLTVGLQAGGQAFSQIIFFDREEDYSAEDQARSARQIDAFRELGH
jgi:lipid-binding SYLF domain-containing protein